MPYYRISRLCQEYVIVEADTAERALLDLDSGNHFWQVNPPVSYGRPELVDGSELCEAGEHDDRLIEEDHNDIIIMGLQCTRCARYEQLATAPSPEFWSERLQRMRETYKSLYEEE